MEQEHKKNLNDNDATSSAANIENKTNFIRRNGQISVEHDRNNFMPTIPSKPVRQTILSKKEKNTNAQIDHQANDCKSDAPVANATETDEIEFLLDEIKDLEVPACRTDSEQDFEIDGSRVDLDLSLHLDSPIDTSWYYFSILLFV